MLAYAWNVFFLLLLINQGNGGILSRLLKGEKDDGNNQPRFCSIKRAVKNIGKCSSSYTNNWISGRDVEGNADRPDDALLPPWVNLDLFRQGQEFAQEYLFSVLLGHLFGLFTSLYPDGIHMLQFSTMSSTPDFARKRNLATLTQVVAWYQGTVKKMPQGNDTDIIISLLETRRRHKLVADEARKQKAATGFVVEEGSLSANYTFTTAVGGPFFQDLEEGIPQNLKGLPPSSWTNVTIDPFNQQMMALTQFAFAGTPILYPERLGIHASEDEIWAFTHLWAVIGYALGIKDEYNICLQPNLGFTRKLFQQIWQEYNVPTMFHMTQDGKVLLETTLQGISEVLGGIPLSPNLQMYLMMKHLLQIPAKHTEAELTITDKLQSGVIDTLYLPTYKFNVLQRKLLNKIAWGAVSISGNELFGDVFETLAGRVRNVFFAKWN